MGLLIKVLSREAQVNGNPVLHGLDVAEGIAPPGPDRDFGLIGGGPWGVQVIGVDIGNGAAFDLGNRGIVTPDVGLLGGTGSAGLEDEITS